MATYRTHNQNAAYFVQVRSCERRLLILALESCEGDIELAADVLGISKGFFVFRSEQLGGVFSGSYIKEPPDDISEYVEPEEIVPDEQLQASYRVEPCEEPYEEPLPPLVPEDDQPDSPNELSVEAPTATETPQPEVEVEADSTPVQDSPPGDSTREQGRRLGRPRAKSPSAEFMTSREAEEALGVSTAGLNYLKNKGHLTPKWDADNSALLYSRVQVEAVAKERAAKRSQ